MRSSIAAQLEAKLPSKLVQELLDAHEEAKRHFYLGSLRPAEVEGGRFCEAVFRILQFVTEATFTPLGKTLPSSDKLIQRLENAGPHFSDSIRLHIPRSLRLVYDIRNKRDAAHLADGIDPNLQDATLVVGVLDWVLAELLRLFHDVPPNRALEMVNGIVKRLAPVIQDFEGFLKVLKPTLGATDHCTILLYHSGDAGATLDELTSWARPPMRRNIRRTLDALVNKHDYAHYNGVRYYITRRGEQHVERKNLVVPEQVK